MLSDNNLDVYRDNFDAIENAFNDQGFISDDESDHSEKGRAAHIERVQKRY